MRMLSFIAISVKQNNSPGGLPVADGNNNIWLAKNYLGLMPYLSLKLISVLMTWMELVVDFEHSFFQHMSVNLRGGDIGMTEHLLDGSQISASI